MLTTWKQTRTTIEYPQLGRGNIANKESTRKKNKSKKFLASEEEKEEDAVFFSTIQDVVVMGAQFVPPFSHRVNASSLPSFGKSSKKRRKINNDAVMEKEPILWITLPHRVVLMENKGEKSTNDGTMIESKSRTYVARPGASSRFTLRGNIGKHSSLSSSGNDDGGATAAFAGMIPPGARFEPSSNLIYAIRNGGAEIAIWSAAPSSILPGPDDDVGPIKINGTGGTNDAHESIADTIISTRLKLPGGKHAVTLTPISIPASLQGGEAIISAVGAVGCCEDGSIWLAIRLKSDKKCCKFQILIVDGSSHEGIKEPSSSSRSGVRATKRRKTSTAEKHDVWRLFDSTAKGSNDKSSILLSNHSVLLSEDNAVVYRSHQLRVDIKEVGSNSHVTVRIESSTTKNIMKLDKSTGHIAVKLDPDADSLLIVHDEFDGRWLVTSVNLSGSDGPLIDSVRTFPLPKEHMMSATVFSFGMLGQNTVAVLMKSQSSKSNSCMMVLRIIDFRRKAELSSMYWLEGNDMGIDEVDLSFNNTPRVKVLNDKRCHAMVTNASNGSIALMTTANEDAGLLHIVYSKLETRPAGVDSAPISSDCNSLASALRFAALSEHTQTTAWPSLNVVKTIETDSITQSTSDDNAFDEACKLLTTSAKEVIQRSESSMVGNGVITNGKSKVGSNSSTKDVHSVSWRKVYQDCCTLLSNTTAKGVNQSSSMVNGIKNGTTNISAVEVPKSFLEVAFKETTNILLSYDGVEAPISSKRDIQGTVRDATSVLLEILQTELISSRRDYGIKCNSRDHIFLSILHACPTLSQAENRHQTIGKLHVMNAMLENVQDISEGVLVSILRFLLLNVSLDDVVAYYSSASDASERGFKLLKQYTAKSSSDAQEERRNLIGTKLLSEAVLDFTSKIVTYSKCNQSFLTNAIRVSINTSGEVETLLLTLAKLLKIGRPRLLQEGCELVGPFLGTIQWITALTDAHMCTILKISNEGGMVIDRIQHAVRSAMAQSEFANEVRELLNVNCVVGKESANRETKPNTSFSMMRETAVLPYTVERLAF